jgi:hypothetical protein
LGWLKLSLSSEPVEALVVHILRLRHLQVGQCGLGLPSAAAATISCSVIATFSASLSTALRTTPSHSPPPCPTRCCFACAAGVGARQLSFSLAAGRLRFLFRLCLGRLLHGVARGLTLAPGQASGFALVLVPRGGRRENTAATPGTCTTLEITRDADRQNKSIKPIVYHQGSVLHNLLQFNFNTASRTPRDSTGNKLRLSFVIRNHESPQKENCNLSPNVRLD